MECDAFVARVLVAVQRALEGSVELVFGGGYEGRGDAGGEEGGGDGAEGAGVGGWW